MTVNDIIALAVAEGNHVEEVTTGWTKVRQVTHMREPMSDGLRRKIMAQASIRYWSVAATPHDPASEGAIDDIEKVSVSFPVPD